MFFPIGLLNTGSATETNQYFWANQTVLFLSDLLVSFFFFVVLSQCTKMSEPHGAGPSKRPRRSEVPETALGQTDYEFPVRTKWLAEAHDYAGSSAVRSCLKALVPTHRNKFGNVSYCSFGVVSCENDDVKQLIATEKAYKAGELVDADELAKLRKCGWCLPDHARHPPAQTTALLSSG